MTLVSDGFSYVAKLDENFKVRKIKRMFVPDLILKVFSF